MLFREITRDDACDGDLPLQKGYLVRVWVQGFRVLGPLGGAAVGGNVFLLGGNLAQTGHACPFFVLLFCFGGGAL